MKPVPASASPTGLQLGKANCQAVVGQTLHGLDVVGGGLLHGHGTLGSAHLLSKPWECAKHKPNRKLGLLEVLKGEARIYKEAPPSTSTLEHIETKVQSPPQVCGLQKSCWQD